MKRLLKKCHTVFRINDRLIVPPYGGLRLIVIVTASSLEDVDISMGGPFAAKVRDT